MESSSAHNLSMAPSLNSLPRWLPCLRQLRRRTDVALFLLLASLVACGIVPATLAIDAGLICNRISGLVPRQRLICRSHPDAMAAVGEGSTLALAECRYQFRNSRWNCYGLPGHLVEYRSIDPLVNIASVGSREAAFVHAIRSAGITHAITAACSRGAMASCGCDPTRLESNASSDSLPGAFGESPQPSLVLGDSGEASPDRTTRDKWAWGGCSADVEYGLSLSRAFVDAREIDEVSQSLVNLHNNRVGRKALRDSVGLGCKCHGISGSCTARTCWTTLPPFRAVGDRLAAVYARAKQVEPIRGERAMRPLLLKLRRSAAATQRRAVPPPALLKPPKKELVYLVKSPDYCEPDPRHASRGTQGRRCNRTSAGEEGCEELCCGRGYDARIQWSVERCNCKFHWCCYVTCDECSVAQEECICR